MLQSIQQKDKIHYQALQYLVYKTSAFAFTQIDGFRVTDTLSHLKAKRRSKPFEEEAGLNVHKEKAWEIQETVTSSLIHAVQYHAFIGHLMSSLVHQCFFTTLASTHALIPLWSMEKCKSYSPDLIIYEEEEKNSYLDRSVARFVVGKGS